MPLSGRVWVNQFATSRSTRDLAEPFRGNVERFIAALRAARANVIIAATLRPPQRAYLMHYAFRIAREGLNPQQVPSRADINIDWVHRDNRGNLDLAASRRAAEDMVQAFHIVYRPALQSRHTQGRAIDMNVTWTNNLIIMNGRGRRVTITSRPHTGADNTDLHQVGASYGVHKLRTDPPHWSIDGH